MRKISSQNPSGTRSILKGFLYSTAVVAMIASPAQANEMDGMRTELQNLLDRMERIEDQQVAAEKMAPATFNRQYIRKRAPQMWDRFAPYDVRDDYIMPETARANGVVGGDIPGSFKVPGSDTSMSISGNLLMGATWDGGQAEGPFSTWGHAGLIQPDGAGTRGNGQFRLESLANSLAVTTSSETAMGPLTTSLVMVWDAAAPGVESTLSQGFDELVNASMGFGNWLFGLQGFAFTSGACYGETVATGGAPCPLGRGPAIQYSGGGGGMSYRVQLIHPVAQLDADGLADVAGVNQNGSIPELQARLAFSAGAANIGLGLQLREFGYQGGQGTGLTGAVDDTATGFGIFPEVQIPMGRDTLYAGVAYTDGGRNTNINHSLWTGGRGEEGVITANGSIDTTETVSVHTYFTHWWNDTMRSTLHASGGNSNPSDDTVGAAATTPPLTKWRSLTGNLVWSLMPRVTTGVGVTYHDALFRGDQGNTGNTGSDESNEAVEGHWRISVSY